MRLALDAIHMRVCVCLSLSVCVCVRCLQHFEDGLDQQGREVVLQEEQQGLHTIMGVEHITHTHTHTHER